MRIRPNNNQVFFGNAGTTASNLTRPKVLRCPGPLAKPKESVPALTRGISKQVYGLENILL